MKFNKNQYEEYFDMFNYYNLITNIDKNYRLYFDKKNKSFVIINIANHNEICLKFNSFSIDLLNILQKSRIENSKNIYRYIDDFNNNLSTKKINKLKDEFKQKSNDLLNYSKRVSSISNNDTIKIIEGKYA